MFFLGDTFNFSKENYGVLKKNEAFLFVLPFPIGLPEDIYLNPGNPEDYDALVYMISQEVDGKMEKSK